MPKVKVSTGIELFVEEHGSGPPLVLIHGRGYWRFAWWKQVPFLSRWFRLLRPVSAVALVEACCQEGGSCHA